MRDLSVLWRICRGYFIEYTSSEISNRAFIIEFTIMSEEQLHLCTPTKKSVNGKYHIDEWVQIVMGNSDVCSALSESIPQHTKIACPYTESTNLIRNNKVLAVLEDILWRILIIYIFSVWMCGTRCSNPYYHETVIKIFRRKSLALFGRIVLKEKYGNCTHKRCVIASVNIIKWRDRLPGDWLSPQILNESILSEGPIGASFKFLSQFYLKINFQDQFPPYVLKMIIY